MIPVLFLAGGDGDGEPVARGGQGTGGKRGEGAGRIIGPVEVDDSLPIAVWRVHCQKASAAVGLLAAGGVGEDEREGFVGLAQRDEPLLCSVEREMQHPR